MARTTMAWGARLAGTLAGVALAGWAALADPHWVERHVLGSYCTTSLPPWAMVHALRWAAAAVAVVAVLAAPALARRLRRASLRPTAASVLPILVAVAASLAVAEGVMRRLHDRLAPGAQTAAAEGREVPMTRADARLGWSYIPGRTTWVELGGRPIPYVIDADGNRAASSDALPDPDRPTVLFAGESIAFGYGLPYEETFPSLVGRDLGIQTVNLAVVGYGNDQAHHRVLDALERYRRPLAVVTLFVPSQIRRNVDIWRPRLALGPGGALAPVPPSTGPRIAKLLQQLPYHGDDALRVTAAILRATAEAARARGAFPLFVVTNYGPPCVRNDGEEAWLFEELFVRQALPFVRVDLDPEDLLPGVLERHPSLRGTRKLAAAIERALAEREPASGGPRHGSALQTKDE
jgi:hypothetical protein